MNLFYDSYAVYHPDHVGACLPYWRVTHVALQPGPWPDPALPATKHQRTQGYINNLHPNRTHTQEGLLEPIQYHPPRGYNVLVEGLSQQGVQKLSCLLAAGLLGPYHTPESECQLPPLMGPKDSAVPHLRVTDETGAALRDPLSPVPSSLDSNASTLEESFPATPDIDLHMTDVEHQDGNAGSPDPPTPSEGSDSDYDCSDDTVVNGENTGQDIKFNPEGVWRARRIPPIVKLDRPSPRRNSRSVAPSRRRLHARNTSFDAKCNGYYAEIEADSNKCKWECRYGTCTQRKVRKDAIIAHVMGHLNLKPYVCGIDGCPNSYARVSDNLRHQRCHMGDMRKFVCACGKSYTRADVLKRHRLRCYQGGLDDAESASVS